MANTILKIYELQDIGKGIIDTLTEDNLLKIFDSSQGLQAVLNIDSYLPYSNYIIIEQSLSILSGTGDQSNGIIIKDKSQGSSITPIVNIGKNLYNRGQIGAISFYPTQIIVSDGLNSKGLEYAADYKANFTNNSLVSKLYTDTAISTAIAAIPPPTGAETKLQAGSNIVLSGNGTTLTPYIISTPTTPKIVTMNLTGWTLNKQHTLSTSLSGVTLIDVQVKLECLSNDLGYTTGDIVTVNSPELNDSGGHPDQGIGVQFKTGTPGTIRVLTKSFITIMGPWTADGATGTTVNISDSSKWAIRLIIIHT